MNILAIDSSLAMTLTVFFHEASETNTSATEIPVLISLLDTDTL